MNFWLAFLFVLAQASCYDYEYFDPDTNQAVGDACDIQRAQAAASGTSGQPMTISAAPFSNAAPVATYSTPFSNAPSFSSAPLTNPSFSTGVVFPSTPAFSTGAVYSGTPTFSTGAVYSGATSFSTGAVYPSSPVPAFSNAQIYASAPVSVISSAPIYGPAVSFPQATVYGSASRLPVASRTVAVVPAPVVTRAPVAVAPKGQISAELQYYKDLGEKQARQHKQNARIVKDASEDLSRSSLINRLVAGSGNAAPWYPAIRLSSQRDAAGAYKSEKRIANKNAEDAYQRFQKDPSRLNLLVSKYQDLNADLRDSAYHYNVVNSATFGQRIATGGLFGSFGGGLLGGLTQIVTQKKQSEDLQDTQRQMQRIARQIQAEAKVAAQGASTQGSVQQRLIGMNSYGPQRAGY